MSDALVADASSIDVVERADGTVVISQRPLVSPLLSIAAVLIGSAILAAAWHAGNGWVVIALFPGASLAGGGLGLLCGDASWTWMRAGATEVELSRRVLFFRVHKTLARPVDISAPARGLEVTHASKRYPCAPGLNSMDSTKLVNYLLAKFPR